MFQNAAGVCLVIVLLGLHTHARAQSDSDSALVHRSTVISELSLLGRSTVHSLTGPLRWNDSQLRRTGGALIGLVALSSLDAAGRVFMRDQRAPHWDRITARVERLGTIENWVVLGGLYATGLLRGDGKAREVAMEGVASSFVAGALITPTLQYIVGRSRPRRDDGVHTFNAFSGNISLPSGHATQAFAVASVIAAEYDHVVVQLLAYGAAGSVAAARMYHDAHFLSDVAAAAMIGTVVGRTVARYGSSRRQRVRLEAAPGAGGSYTLNISVPAR